MQNYTDTDNSTNTTINTTDRNDSLWELAKRRAGFKKSAISYIVVNLFLIAVWYFTSRGHVYFWPIWPILGWGIGLVFQYLNAYHYNNYFSIEKEYEKLKNNH